MITIVNYGMGNLRSIQYKLQKERIESIISSSIDDILQADKLILPGVGHFSQAMANLHELELINILNRQVLEHKIPIMGICLGFQLFANYSEEGNVKGLGWINAEIKKFNFDEIKENLSIPHVGWEHIQIKKESYLFDNIPRDKRFYFTHSYYMSCKNKSDVLCTTDYGGEFVAGIQHENICGFQFHPEKSHKSGFEILKNWTANGR